VISLFDTEFVLKGIFPKEFSKDFHIEESDEEKPGVILDYDKDGNIAGLEILDASRRMENPPSVEYAVGG
jgi:uncharacterized protein YuzE